MSRFLEDLKLRADIVDVIGSYIPLTKTGSNYKALCPFHNEKTPSFFVSPQKQIFHCFGCGKGGNVFSFIMEYEKVSFYEAVEILAKKYGVSLPSQRRQLNRNSNLFSVERIYEVNKLVSNYYYGMLFGKDGKKALDYLLARGLTLPIVKKFRLGYAPNKWQSLYDFFKTKKISNINKLLSEAGLLIASQDRYYDRFRDRIIFPVFDIQSRVVGFGARVLDNSLPKYINSPETHVFKKSNLLYGLHFAKQFISDLGYVLIVEGYMDVISLFQHGIKNSVATLGTALTLEHLGIISRYTNSVVLLFDSDSAGISAAVRAVKLMLPSRISVKVAVLPDGLDPGEFFTHYTKSDFFSVIKQAQDGFIFLLETLSKQFDLSDLKQRSLFLNELFLLLRGVQDSIIQSGYFKLIADFLRISERLIIKEYNKFIVKRQDRSISYIEDEQTKYLFSGPEVELLKLALLDSSFVKRVKEILQPADFANICLWNLFNFVSTKQNYIISDVLLAIQCGDLKVDKDVEDWLYKISVEALGDKEELFKKAVELLKVKRLKAQINQLQKLIKQKKANSEDFSALLPELNKLLKQMHACKK